MERGEQIRRAFASGVNHVLTSALIEQYRGRFYILFGDIYYASSWFRDDLVLEVHPFLMMDIIHSMGSMSGPYLEGPLENGSTHYLVLGLEINTSIHCPEGYIKIKRKNT